MARSGHTRRRTRTKRSRLPINLGSHPAAFDMWAPEELCGLMCLFVALRTVWGTPVGATVQRHVTCMFHVSGGGFEGSRLESVVLRRFELSSPRPPEAFAFTLGLRNPVWRYTAATLLRPRQEPPTFFFSPCYMCCGLTRRGKSPNGHTRLSWLK